MAAALDRVGFGGRIDAGASLAPLTTYRLGGPASLLVEPASDDDLVRLGVAARDLDVPVLVVGRGSNLVVSDHGWRGIAVRLGPAFSWIAEGREGIVRAGGATSLPQVANRAARLGRAGLEFAVGIPGAVGGAVRMNAGAHGAEVGDVLVDVVYVDLEGGTTETRRGGELGFSYRRAATLPPTAIVVAAAFGLAAADPSEIRDRMTRWRRHRAATQPGAVQNAGSVFRNPPGDSAGRLVEAAGLKGLRRGGAEVSRLHANFFMALPGARAQDVYDLVVEVRRRVLEVHGVDLVPEIHFVGAFEGPPMTAPAGSS